MIDKVKSFAVKYWKYLAAAAVVVVIALIAGENVAWIVE